jgi:hypothetical protein
MIPREYFLNFNIKNKAEFIERCIFNPLFESYNHIKKKQEFKNSEEPPITKEIYRYIKKSSSISTAINGRWVIVHYNPTEVENDGERKPDLEFTIAGGFRIFFEAKRIYRDDSCSIYCGKKGLGRFLSGYYSPEDVDGGMIAYVQKGDILKVQEKIIGMVWKKDCINLNRAVGNDFTFLSVHERKSNADIKIYHMFFDLTGVT